MRLKVTVLPGDGVGPEVTAEAVRVLRVVADIYGHNFEFEERLIGGAAIKQTGTPLPTATLDACLESDAVLLGAVGSPEHDHLPSDKRAEAGHRLFAASRRGGCGRRHPLRARAARRSLLR
jgi:3-isopropylmalate dehydrogenase